MSTQVVRICAELEAVFKIPALKQTDRKLRLMWLERAPNLIAEAVEEFERSRVQRWGRRALEFGNRERRSSWA